MLSTNMTENNESRIEFPNKDPDEWKMFYPFIDPFQIGEALSTHATINDENVMILVPWFHELQMDSLYQQCDQFLSDKVLSLARAEKVKNYWGLKLDESFWDRTGYNNIRNYEERMRVLKIRSETFSDIIKLLEFSCIYDLEKTKKEAEGVIRVILDEDMLGETYDLFDDLPTIKILTSLFLPLSEMEETGEDDTYKYFVSNGKSQVLWESLTEWGMFEDEFEAELKSLSLEDINTSSMFPVLVKTFIVQCYIDDRAGKIKRSVRQVFNDWVNKAPDLLYENTNVSHRSDARETLIQMMREWEENNKKDFKELRISLPADIYSSDEE